VQTPPAFSMSSSIPWELVNDLKCESGTDLVIGDCRVMGQSQGIASQAAEDFRSNLLMSSNHQNCAGSA
jgi:hypothetical protein